MLASTSGLESEKGSLFLKMCLRHQSRVFCRIVVLVGVSVIVGAYFLNVHNEYEIENVIQEITDTFRSNNGLEIAIKEKDKTKPEKNNEQAKKDKEQTEKHNEQTERDSAKQKEQQPSLRTLTQAQKQQDQQGQERKLEGQQKQQHQPQQQQQQQQPLPQSKSQDGFHGSRYAEVKDIPDVFVKTVSCSALIDDNTDRQNATLTNYISDKTLSSEELTKRTYNCPIFIQDRHYITKPISPEEAEFPIAICLMMYTDAGRAERLLRAIYRPQNVYCLHLDAKSSPEVVEAMQSLAACFPNIHLSSRRVDVVWGRYSILEPEYICMRDLWKYPKWKYFINLTGQEFPLKTNLEIVRILKVYNGANDVSGQPYDQQDTSNRGRLKYDVNRQLKKPFPHPIRFFKGATHVTLSRAFVGFLLHDPVAEELRAWSEDLTFPEEMVIPTLQHNPSLGAPGAYTGPTAKGLASAGRHVIWVYEEIDNRCRGEVVRSVCIFGAGDLPDLARSPKLIANKFFMDVQPVAYDCIEELHFNRTREDVTGSRPFNSTFFKSLPFVENALRNITTTYE